MPDQISTHPTEESVARAIFDRVHPGEDMAKWDAGIVSSYYSEARDVIRAYRQSLSEQGYVLVPREPTPQMVKAGWAGGDWCKPIISYHDEDAPQQCWRAMIDAANE